MSDLKVKMVCRTCGSDNVLSDAWAEWNVETQDWEISSVFDDAYCNDCDHPHEAQQGDGVSPETQKLIHSSAGWFVGCSFVFGVIAWINNILMLFIKDETFIQMMLRIVGIPVYPIGMFLGVLT